MNNLIENYALTRYEMLNSCIMIKPVMLLFSHYDLNSISIDNSDLKSSIFESLFIKCCPTPTLSSTPLFPGIIN